MEVAKEVSPVAPREATSEFVRSAASLFAGHCLGNLRPVLKPFALSRVLLIGLTCLLALVRRQSPLDLWNRWDSRWYVGIASHGYHFSIHGKPALAFFPLYPLLIRLGMNPGLRGELFAMVLSNAAFLAALLYLYLLVLAEHGEQTARRSAWLLSLFPMAFFTFAPYSESLFLLAAIASFCHARRGDALIAGVWLAAAITTRSTGLILLLPVLLFLGPRRLRSWLLGLGPSVLAIGAYLYYLHSQHILVSGLFNAQRAWHRELTFPWTGFVSSLSWLAQQGTQHPELSAENVFQLTVTLVFLVLTVMAWRSLDTGMKLYCAGFWLIVLINPEWRDGYYAPFSSVDRFVLALFPLAIWAAASLSQRRFRAILMASVVTLVSTATVHALGGWVG